MYKIVQNSMSSYRITIPQVLGIPLSLKLVDILRSNINITKIIDERSLCLLYKVN